MVVALIFFLGIANFALQRAVFESGHPLLAHMPWLAGKQGRRFAFTLEFLLLLAAMLLAANGWPGLAIAYAFYTGLNVFTAWLILNNRI